MKYKKFLWISNLVILTLLFLSLFGLSDFGKLFLEYNLHTHYIILFIILFFGLFLFIALEVLFFFYKFNLINIFKNFKDMSPSSLYLGSLVIFVCVWIGYFIYFYSNYLLLNNRLVLSGVMYLGLSLFVLIFSFNFNILVKSFLFLGFTFFCLSGMIDMFVFFNYLIFGELFFISNFIYLFKILGFFSLLFSYVGVYEK
jgi:hypothetical protein